MQPDLTFQAASKRFHANKWVLRDKGVSALHKLHYSDKVISPIACLGASHRPIYTNHFFFFPPLLFSRRRSIDTGLFYWAASRHRLFLYWPVSRCHLAKLDIKNCRLMRMVVGPPAGTNLTWHHHETEFKMGGTAKKKVEADYAGPKLWSASLPSECWTRRILAWNMKGPRKGKRRAYTWETALGTSCIWRNFNNWIVEAATYGHWVRLKQHCIFFMWYKKCFGKVLHFIYLRPRRGANDLRLSATVYTL